MFSNLSQNKNSREGKMNMNMRFKKMMALFLSFIMVLGLVPITALADDGPINTSGNANWNEIVAFTPLDADVLSQTVLLGTELSDLILPPTLTAIVRTTTPSALTVATPSDLLIDEVYTDYDAGLPYESAMQEDFALSEMEVPVIWQTWPDFDGEAQGTYMFTPQIIGDFVLSAILPNIFVTVIAEELPPYVDGEIIAFAELDDEIASQVVLFGTELSELVLPEVLISTVVSLIPLELVDDGQSEFSFLEVEVPVVWQSQPYYDENEPGLYIFYPIISDDFTVTAIPPIIHVTVLDEDILSYEDGEIVSFMPLPMVVALQTVPFGTEFQYLNLPRSLRATMIVSSTDEPSDEIATVGFDAVETDLPLGLVLIEVDVPVTWESSPYYDHFSPGTYTFTPSIVGDFVVSVIPPQIFVTVEFSSLDPLSTQALIGQGALLQGWNPFATIPSQRDLLRQNLSFSNDIFLPSAESVFAPWMHYQPSFRTDARSATGRTMLEFTSRANINLGASSGTSETETSTSGWSAGLTIGPKDKAQGSIGYSSSSTQTFVTSASNSFGTSIEMRWRDATESIFFQHRAFRQEGIHRIDFDRIPEDVMRSQLDPNFLADLLNPGVSPSTLFDRYGALFLTRYALGGWMEVNAAATYVEFSDPSRISEILGQPPIAGASEPSPTDIANALNFANGINNLRNLNQNFTGGRYESHAFARAFGGAGGIALGTDPNQLSSIINAWTQSFNHTNWEILTDDRMMVENSGILRAFPIWELVPDTHAERREQIRAAFNELAQDMNREFFDTFIYSDANIPQRPTMPRPDVNGVTFISTPAQLNAVRNSLSGRFVLLNDIDLRGTTFENWTPIGTAASPFNGTFDGNGNSIIGVRVANAPGHANPGLFGVVGTNGRVQTLRVVYSSRAGGIAGINNGTITNSHAEWDFAPTVPVINTVAQLPNNVRITGQRVLVDLAANSIAGGSLSGRTIFVDANVQTIMFRGLPNRWYEGISIVVEGNTDVIFENFQLFNFSSQRSALSFTGVNPALISTGFTNGVFDQGTFNALNANNNLYIGGNADLTVQHWTDSWLLARGSAGRHAIHVGGTLDIALSGRLTAIGGDGVLGTNGVAGTNGANGTNGVRGANGSTSESGGSPTGRNGTSGTMGATVPTAGIAGGAGGAGGSGISTRTLNIRNTSNVFIQGGLGGSGGTGGNGGVGGIGGAGGAGGDGVRQNYGFLNLGTRWGHGGLGGRGGDGRQGAAGGNGGAGGRGGNSVTFTVGTSFTRSASSVVTLEAGRGGNGGTGGLGGNGGRGGNGGAGGWRHTGHNGTTNGSGGSGGWGGWGGNGGTGGTGGANGTNFAIAGASSSSPANSSGGLGGRGGTGGLRGTAAVSHQPLVTSYATRTPGVDGQPGGAGTDRSNTRATNGTSTNLRSTVGTPTTNNATMWTGPRIVIENQIGQLNYEPNEIFCASVLTMRLINAGSLSGLLTADDVTVFFDFRNTGNTVVTITFDGPTGRIVRYVPVVVNPPTVAEVVVAVPRDTFFVGDTFTDAGISLDVIFTNGDLVTLRHPAVRGNAPANVTASAGRRYVPVTFPASVTHMGRTHSLTAFNPRSYAIEIFDVNPEWLEILSDPNRTTFVEGEALDLSGMVLRLHYTNGNHRILPLASVNFAPAHGTILNEVNSAFNVAASFPGVPAVNFQVVVNADPITTLVVMRNPNQMTYIDGAVFNPYGMEVYAQRQSGRFTTIDPIPLGNLDWFRGPLRTGVSSVNVIFHTGTQFISTSVTGINVLPVSQVGIEIANMPNRTDYVEGEQFDPTGLVVNRVLNNGTRILNIDFTVSHGVLSPEDVYVVVRDNSHCNIGCVECTVIVPITVREMSIVNVVNTQAPNRTVFEEGEYFDPTGMIIQAIFDNGHIDDNVTEFEFEPNRPLLIEDAEIIVTFGGISTSIPITVTVVKPREITLNRSSLVMLVDSTDFLVETVLPFNAYNRTVTWSSSNPSVASVNEIGLVTALSAGTTTITATTAEGGLTASSTITVITETAALMTVSTVAYLPGQSITVDIDLANNPGFAGMVLKVSFPPELTLTRYMLNVSAEDMDLLQGFTGPDGVTMGAPTSISDHFFLVWGRTADFTRDGTIVTLTFAICPDAEPGVYPIVVAFEQHDGPRAPVNLQGQPLNIHIRDGAAIALNYILGNVTNSGTVGPTDLVRLARWVAGHNVEINSMAADVTGAGQIGPADLVRLARWVAGHFGGLTIEQVLEWQRDFAHLTLEQAIAMFNPSIVSEEE